MKMAVTDNVTRTIKARREGLEKLGIRVNVHAVLTGPDGAVKYDEWGGNLITDVGDSICANRLFDDAEDNITGMKLGTGTTVVAKNSTGSGMTTYISGSQEALDATATAATKGAGLGWRTEFVCTWIAGDVTNATINEVCITNQTALADNTSAEADTFGRFVFGTTINKEAGDELIVTWQVDFLGA